MQRLLTRGCEVLVTLGLLGLTFGCAKTEYVGNGNKGFWSDQPAQVAPNDAFVKAQPFLEATWEARCQSLHQDDGYCDKLPVDHMVRKGGYYYVTRTSYPYKSYDALTDYAVRVDAKTGEVTPYK
jgi:hypothetical protein